MARDANPIDSGGPLLPQLLGAELVLVLEREITELKLQPGAKLVVDKLAERFGLSRSPVREALQTLAGNGLVEHIPRRGMFVAPLSIERLDEIYSCRRPLEALAAAGAARNPSAALRAALSKLLDRMDAATAKGRRDAAFSTNVSFTNLIHESCGNELLKGLLKTLDKQALRYRYYCYLSLDEMVQADIAANHAIAEAITAGEAHAAANLTERLIDESWRMVREALLAAPGLAPNVPSENADPLAGRAPGADRGAPAPNPTAPPKSRPVPDWLKGRTDEQD